MAHDDDDVSSRLDFGFAIDLSLQIFGGFVLLVSTMRKLPAIGIHFDIIV